MTDQRGAIDGSRLRSFIGLSIGLVGPRANLAVSGVLITLYVQHRASGALAVTFALTANRLVSWLTYPVVGRLSDRTRTRVGRRTPYMAASLIVMGASTWMFTVVRGYWMLVLFIVIARQASAVFTLTNVAVVPEVFGRSRWLKALVLTAVLGTLASLTVKATVITSWKQNQPSTWNLPFEVAAAFMVGVGIVVLLLVRESPAARSGAETDRRQRAGSSRRELRGILAGPNAAVLVSGSLLFWAGIGSTAYVAILFFQRVLHAGAGAQTIAGLAIGVPVFVVGIVLGVPISRVLSPRQLAIGAPLIGAALAGVQYFDTHLWQAVVLSYIGAPFIGAYIIVLAPMLLQLLPRSGGLGERLGTLLSPFNLCSVALAYVAAAVVDATGNYRLIWLFPAATGIAHAVVNCWLRFPPHQPARPDMVTRVWRWSIAQAEAMSETGIVAGLLTAPLLGVVTDDDADSAVVVDLAREVLGNPYEPDEPGGDDGEPERPPPPVPPGLAGVTHVGGGPGAGGRGGDQKSGTGDGDGSGLGSRSEAAVPAGGVAPSASSSGPCTGTASGNSTDSECPTDPDPGSVSDAGSVPGTEPGSDHDAGPNSGPSPGRSSSGVHRRDSVPDSGRTARASRRPK